MPAYFTNPTRPVLAPSDVAALRDEPSSLLVAGMLAIFATTSAGALFTKGVYYDPLSSDADDGSSTFKPNDKAGGDPGRWKLHPGLSGGASSPNFADPVLRVNWAEGANDALPSVLCGLSVDRGSSGGIERDRAGLFWNEADDTFRLGFSSADDSTLTGTYAPLVAGGLYSGGGGSSGFIRLRQDETITANIDGTTYNPVTGTAFGIGAFGDTDLAAATLDAGGDVEITSRLSTVAAQGSHFYVRDASGLNETLDVSVGGAFVKVSGDLQAFNGGTKVFEVDVSAALTRAHGVLRVYDTLGSTIYFDASSSEVVVRRDGIGTSSAAVFVLRNASDTTSPNPSVQRSPTFQREARVRLSGTDTGYWIRQQFVPTTSSTWRDVIEVSRNGGSTWSEFARLTDATTNQFVEAFLAANAFATTTGGGFFFDADYSGMFRGGSGDLQIFARSSSLPLLLRSPTSSAGQASFRLYANGGTRGADETLVEFGDVAAGFTRRSGIRGDGTYDGPAWRDAGAAKTANYTAKARELVLLDPSGGAFDLTLPDATTCARQLIKAACVALSANVVTLKTTSGQTINGAASGTLTLGNATTLETGTFTSDGANWRFERVAT